MEDVLTWEQIEARYAPEWVLVGELQADATLNVTAGRELFHSADGEKVYRKARDLMPGRFAVRYLGGWPDDMELVL